MSSMQYETVKMHEAEYAWKSEGWIALGEEDSVQEKLVDGNVKCLIGLGFIPVIVGIAISIWPMVLVGIGPWLLAWLDISRRKRGRVHKGR